MTSTKLLEQFLTLTAVVALTIGATAVGRCQPQKKDLVELGVNGDKNRFWRVDCSDDEFIVRGFLPGTRNFVKRNFEESHDWMKVAGCYMGYDLEGKSKEVLTRQGYGKSAQWVKHGGRFSMRLQVRHGKLKGWWVTLKISKEKPERGKPALARLVLVKEEEKAAVFGWEDPDDRGR